MSEAFNPYREWLGLETDNCQLNHYQLLDVADFEEDVAKIHSAADRALARVRSHRPGAQAAAWAQLLDAIATAKSCLGDPARKAAYDAALRSGNAPSEPLPTIDSPRPAAGSVNEEPLDTAQSSRPEVALVNQSPDLFPPGMQPNKSATARGPAPSDRSNDLHPRGGRRVVESPTSPAAAASPATVNKRATADRPTRQKPKRSPPPLPPAAQTPESATSDDAFMSATQGDSAGDVPTPLPPAPMNAHVAPPRRQQPSLLPIVVSITAVLVVTTVIVMLLAMREQTSGSSSVQPSPAIPSSPGEFAQSSRRNAPPQPLGSGTDARAAGQIAPRPDEPAPHVGQPKGLAANASHPPPDSDVSQPASAIDAPEPTATLPPPTASQPPAATPAPDSHVGTTSAAGSDAQPAVDAAEPTRLEKALRAAMRAMGEHQFRRARKELAAAEAVAVSPEHQARVARTRRLADCNERFWDVVTDVVGSFNGAEELSIGSGELVVIVVETGPRSLTIHNQGKNTRYSFVDMPPGLALAVARLRLNETEADDLVLLGAGLATVADRQAKYLDEARKYWTRAASAGAQVQDLLLTLTDKYDLTP